ncbi:MAG: hypothetical protein MJZ87_02885, partial [Bacteroidales bacterium]|nr:hypothetical protein [Bacteroidales bacterium]
IVMLFIFNKLYYIELTLISENLWVVIFPRISTNHIEIPLRPPTVGLAEWCARIVGAGDIMGGGTTSVTTSLCVRRRPSVFFPERSSHHSARLRSSRSGISNVNHVTQ